MDVECRSQNASRARACAAFLLVLLLIAGGQPARASTDSLQNLRELSLEDLSSLDVTSVSKQREALASAPAAIYVITHDEIIRSGAESVPEMLRLAPNLEVFQTSPSNYVITARGFSGNTTDQNFPDKLLVLIDGRSVYNPLFSGMYWDMQEVLPEDVDRIEVISGPGAALFGANAVNGVINIITRKSGDTQGGVLDLGAGNIESSASLQYGGKIGDDVAYRIYAKAFRDRSFDNTSGTTAHDGWDKPQGGFRVDWDHGGDTFTFQGSFYAGSEDQLGAPNQDLNGENVQANWQHPMADGSTLDVLAYYDQTERISADGNGGFTLRTFDIEMQHNFSWGSLSNIVWGVGERVSPYSIVSRLSPVSSLIFVPSTGTLNLADAFVQDRLALTDKFDLTLGLKIEDDPYSGVTPMPSARAAYTFAPGALFWAAVSRVIRSPTPFDTSVEEKLGNTVFLTGDPDFLPEKLTAYEIGYRQQITPRASISVSAYIDDYNDLKTIELGPGGGLPLRWGNMMRGRAYGVEAWANDQVADWWRLSASLNLLSENLSFAPGASGLLGVAQAGDDPHIQSTLRSSMNLTDRVSLDADLRFVGALHNPHVPAYIELNGRAAWAISDRVDIGLSGFNLLHAHHLEFPPPSDEIPRSFFVDTRWKF